MFILYFILVPIIVFLLIKEPGIFFPVKACSSPVDVPAIKYGSLACKASAEGSWNWLDVSSPISRCSEKVVFLCFFCFPLLFFHPSLF